MLSSCLLQEQGISYTQVHMAQKNVLMHLLKPDTMNGTVQATSYTVMTMATHLQ